MWPNYWLGYQKLPKGLNPAEYEVVRSYKVTLDNLPSFNSDDQIYLDIDGDYFSNTGYDTVLDLNFKYATSELASVLKTFFDTLIDRNIYPVAISLCQPPKYTSAIDWQFIKLVFSAISKNVGVGDFLIAYEHLNLSGQSARSENVRRNLTLYRLIFDLGNIDNTSNLPDGQITLESENEELNRVIELIKNHHRINDIQIGNILMGLDKADGLRDGVIEIAYLETYVGISSEQFEILDKMLPTWNEE